MSDIETIRMVHIDDGKTADVHPEEVENMQAYGWSVDDGTSAEGGDEYDGISDAELRDRITNITGTAPHPNAKRETLIKKLRDAGAATQANG